MSHVNTINENQHVLIVEDEPALALHLASLLESIGCTCNVVHDGSQAEQAFGKNHYQLVLLDVNLPSIGGIELCKIFRAQNRDIPILLLTAFGDLDTKLLAFDVGADDYITKPFYGKELLAKVKVFLKRSARISTALDAIVVGDLSIDRSSKSVTRQGKSIVLTPKEYGLLEFLALNAGAVVSKAEIARNVWDVAYDTGTNTVEVYISLLRNKVDKPFATRMIVTRSGFGYVLSVDGL